MHVFLTCVTGTSPSGKNISAAAISRLFEYLSASNVSR